MLLKDRLKELRLKRALTQDTVAEHLGVSSQTVSKWERGLTLPDVTMLPKIAVLYQCSIDSLFEMDSFWNKERKDEFLKTIQKLYAEGDYEGAFAALVSEIELNPNEFTYYTDIMLLVLKQKLFEDERIDKMLHLASRAEQYCTEDDIRNEIHRLMMQICSKANNPKYKENAKEFYYKLPSLKHSRDVYAQLVLEGDDLSNQIKQNILYTIDLAECGIRQLISSEMSCKEKLFYYKKAANLYETVLDEKYGGFFDVPLLSNYIEIAKILKSLGDNKSSDKYIQRIFTILERHLNSNQQDISPFVYSANPKNYTSAFINCKKILQLMIDEPLFSEFKANIEDFALKYEKYIICEKCKK